MSNLGWRSGEDWDLGLLPPSFSLFLLGVSHFLLSPFNRQELSNRRNLHLNLSFPLVAMTVNAPRRRRRRSVTSLVAPSVTRDSIFIGQILKQSEIDFRRFDLAPHKVCLYLFSNQAKLVRPYELLPF